MNRLQNQIGNTTMKIIEYQIRKAAVRFVDLNKKIETCEIGC